MLSFLGLKQGPLTAALFLESAVLYRAHLLSPESPERLRHVEDGGLAVDDAGRILAAGPFEAVRAAHPALPVEDLRPCWILPGLVDLHSHLPQYEAVAMDGLELLPWLETFIFPSETRFRDAELARRAARTYFADLLAHGTTTAMVFSTIHRDATHAAFEEAEACGIRLVMGKVMMDCNTPEPLQERTDVSVAQSLELCQDWHGRDGGRLSYAFTPRFAPTCTRELMAQVGDLAGRHGAYVQTHVSENLQELDWVRELFPEASSYVDVYDRAGLLGPRTLLAHGIHLDTNERGTLRRTGTSLAHCPRSNAFLKSGIMPLRRWLDEDLSVGLGTDVGAGPSLDLWAEMAFTCMASKLRWATQRTLAERLRLQGILDEGQRSQVIQALDLVADTPADPTLALWLATLGGAQALRMEDRIGSLEAGKDADFLVVDPHAADPAGADRAPEAPEQVLSRLVYRSSQAMIRGTFVRGRRCASLAKA